MLDVRVDASAKLLAASSATSSAPVQQSSIFTMVQVPARPPSTSWFPEAMENCSGQPTWLVTFVCGICFCSASRTADPRPKRWPPKAQLVIVTSCAAAMAWDK
eukprot:CAMPEP_0175658028 /NCGR_PEP_ID=MMETSP0097-20121207/13219_1 /TAXON_ID=311494 /ORGANISM="Alexandrium monilatum, Strain CCMP3105" /LENGTH=102 /DNA_ID=CAMNT_0016964131 /DNA_START=165 /DNA_END=474 /DNA_ORIENTATION=+